MNPKKNLTTIVSVIYDEIWNKKNFNIISERYHPSSITRRSMRITLGHEEEISFLKEEFFTAFEVIGTLLIDAICVQNDYVWSKYTCRVRHINNFLEFGPSEQILVLTGFHLHRFSEQMLIVQVDNACNLMQLLYQNNHPPLVAEESLSADLRDLYHTIDHKLPTPLTRQEITIISLYLLGASAKEIAQHLHLSFRTIQNHLTKIKFKLNVEHRRNITEAVSQYACLDDFLNIAKQIMAPA